MKYYTVELQYVTRNEVEAIGVKEHMLEYLGTLGLVCTHKTPHDAMADCPGVVITDTIELQPKSEKGGVSRTNTR